jgi:hypothetical protein
MPPPFTFHVEYRDSGVVKINIGGTILKGMAAGVGLMLQGFGERTQDDRILIDYTQVMWEPDDKDMKSLLSVVPRLLPASWNRLSGRVAEVTGPHHRNFMLDYVGGIHEKGMELAYFEDPAAAEAWLKSLPPVPPK